MVTGGASDRRSGDFELNLAPIVDCFTVLITFLIASSAFLAVGSIDLFVSSGTPPADATKPSVALEVRLGRQGMVTLKLSGKRSWEKRVSPLEGHWDLQTVGAQLDAVHQQFPDLQSAALSADDDVEYGEYMRAMEAVRQRLPSVFLGDQE